MEQIPAISIRQPWAELILTGRKTIEVRSWATGFRGALWVHAGLKANPQLEQEFGLADLYKGGYLGSVVLEAIVPLDAERWELWRGRHLCAGEYVPGLYAWLLSSPYKLSCPVQGPGKLNLYYPTPELREALQSVESGIVAPPAYSPTACSGLDIEPGLSGNLPLWAGRH